MRPIKKNHAEFNSEAGTHGHAPLVMAHGLMGFSRIHLGPWTLAAYFRGIPEYLNQLGFRVLVTRVHPTGGIERRARKLAEQIEAAFPGESVHLVGHSMGGLDARQLLREPGWSDRVLSLVTVGTPHLGSLLAERFSPRFKPIAVTFKAIPWDFQGFSDVLPQKARRWHEDHPAPEQIPCYAVAGNPTLQQVCWPLKRLHKELEVLDGPNDGLVSQQSALAFGQPLLTTPLDHFRQMNWFTRGHSAQLWPEIRNLYRQIAEKISCHDPIDQA